MLHTRSLGPGWGGDAEVRKEGRVVPQRRVLQVSCLCVEGLDKLPFRVGDILRKLTRNSRDEPCGEGGAKGTEK